MSANRDEKDCVAVANQTHAIEERIAKRVHRMWRNAKHTIELKFLWHKEEEVAPIPSKRTNDTVGVGFAPKSKSGQQNANQVLILDYKLWVDKTKLNVFLNKKCKTKANIAKCKTKANIEMNFKN